MLTLLQNRHTFTPECENELRTSSRVRDIQPTPCQYDIDMLTITVLNRARPENEERERKTASGRTFKVQG